MSGSILPNSLFTHIELRIVNSSIHFDATSFQKISFDAGYYDEYVRLVDIRQFDSAGSQTYFCRLVEAYPRTISDISYSYAAEEVISFSVQFQFRYFIEP